MARAESFPEPVLESIAAQAQHCLGSLSRTLKPSVDIELREAFKVFNISLAAIQDPSEKALADRVTWHRQWHVQLFQGDLPVGYALLGGEEEPVELQGVFISSLAQAVDDAIQRIDRQELPEDGNPEVDLLIAPSHHLRMLWIQRTGRPIMALETELKREEPYEAEEILSRLREIPPIVGIT